MRFYIFVLLTISNSGGFAQSVNKINRYRVVASISPLGAFSSEWNSPQYLACNTAKNAMYMSPEERKIIYILNLMRKNPKLFARTVVTNYPTTSGQNWLVNVDEYKSLLDTLLKMKPVISLKPDQKCYASSQCHAASTGPSGYVGHARIDKHCDSLLYYNGECIDYGYTGALDIIMHLMIDEGVPSLGHRLICLSSYHGLGVSIQSHKQYGHMAVLDFTY